MESRVAEIPSMSALLLFVVIPVLLMGLVLLSLLRPIRGFTGRRRRPISLSLLSLHRLEQRLGSFLGDLLGQLACHQLIVGLLERISILFGLSIAECPAASYQVGLEHTSSGFLVHRHVS